MDEVSALLARHVSGAKYENLAPGAVSAAIRSTIDTIAAMVAGSGAEGLDSVLALGFSWGGAPQARVVGTGQRLPAPLAAWCNATMARALEIDDCVDFLPVHPSASAVPALFAIADHAGGMSGREFITALAVGQDLKIRMGMAVKLNAMQSGRNNLFKIFGPTAAVARALGLNAGQTQHALGIAFSHAVGDGQCALEGALALRLQQGIVAQGAIVSGLLAQKGFTGAREFLLGRWGYLRSFEPDPDLAALTDGLGSRFLGELISIKPHASCRATHQAIDLTLELRRERGADLPDTVRVRVTVSPEVENLVGLPRSARLRPSSSADAQFSLPYTVAAALRRGRVSLAELDAESYADERLLRLAERVETRADSAMRTEQVVGATRLEAWWPDGTRWVGETRAAKGSPASPVSNEEHLEKLAACSQRARRPVPNGAMRQLQQVCATLDELDDVRVLLDAFA
ncbi:MAG: MmgE/PrpD family protein [Burkholderiaceae bacterium]|nr:MmgE/PrpD family protein [Burkholderiaceae bacterium]